MPPKYQQIGTFACAREASRSEPVGQAESPAGSALTILSCAQRLVSTGRGVPSRSDGDDQKAFGSFLAGLVGASRSGIVGYSMGGYGVVNVVGGGYSKASETGATAPPNRMLAERGAANPEFRKSVDARIKAAIAIGPWGMQGAFWQRVTLHDGRSVTLRKVDQDYDATNRDAAYAAIRDHQRKGEVMTGLLYLSADSKDVPHDQLCPGNDALQKLMAQFR